MKKTVDGLLGNEGSAVANAFCGAAQFRAEHHVIRSLDEHVSAKLLGFPVTEGKFSTQADKVIEELEKEIE